MCAKIKYKHVISYLKKYFERKNIYHLHISNISSVKHQLYPILLDLCNDTQYEVRASGCKSLSVVCKSLGPEMTSSVVIPEMFKYLCDESTLVKTACFQSLVEILTIFNDCKFIFFYTIKNFLNKYLILLLFFQDDTKNYLLKKIQSIIEYGLSIKDEQYLLKITENLGKIITSLNGKNVKRKIYFEFLLKFEFHLFIFRYYDYSGKTFFYRRILPNL